MTSLGWYQHSEADPTRLMMRMHHVTCIERVTKDVFMKRNSFGPQSHTTLRPPADGQQHKHHTNTTQHHMTAPLRRPQTTLSQPGGGGGGGRPAGWCSVSEPVENDPEQSVGGARRKERRALLDLCDGRCERAVTS